MKAKLTALLILCLFSFVVVKGVFAQTLPGFDPSTTDPNVPQNLNTLSQSVLIELMSAVTCQLAGINPTDPQGRCLDVDPATHKIGYVQNGGGLIGSMGSMIGMTFDMPVHTSEYVQNLASNFGIAKKTYAQTANNGGQGFMSLSPLMSAWQVFLNLVYLLFVIIFMLIGLGIIFRRNIDARSVMTVQNALPKVIMVLLLITFSFAIAGFMIDMMYIIMYFFYELFNTIPGLHGQIPNLSPTNLQGITPFGAIGAYSNGGGVWGIAFSASKNVSGIITDVFSGTFGSVMAALISGLITGIASVALPGVGTVIGVGLTIGSIFGGAAVGSREIGFIGGFISFFIILMALLFVLGRLWWTLIKAYVFILIDVTIAPLWIAGSLIPGSPLTAGSWFKHILSYILVFPTAFIMLLLGEEFVQVYTTHGSQFFTPPMIGGGINPKNFGALIGMAIIFMTPEVINIVKDTLKAPKMNSYQGAVTGALGKGVGYAGFLPKKVGHKLFDHDQMGPKGVGSILLDTKVKHPLEGWWAKRNPLKSKTIAEAEIRRNKAELQAGRMSTDEFLRKAKNLAPQLNRGHEGNPVIDETTGNLLQEEDRAGMDRWLPPIPERSREELVSRDASREESVMVRRDINGNILLKGMSGGPTKEDKEYYRNQSALKDLPEESVETQLRKQQERLREIAEDLNAGKNISEQDELFKGLENDLRNDIRFEKVLENVRELNKNNGKGEPELHKEARVSFARNNPILLARYELRDEVRAKSKSHSGVDEEKAP